MSGSGWMRLVGLLLGEFGAIVMAAALCQVCLRGARSRRMIWQAAFASMILMLGVEFSGLRARLSFAENKTRRHFVFTTSVTEPARRFPSLPLPPEKNPPVVVARDTRRVVTWPGWVWLAGVAFFLTRGVSARIWLARRRRAGGSAEAEVLESVQQLQIALRLKSVEVKVWRELKSPVAFGVFRPTVALPEDFGSRFSAVEQRAMLAHEMAHLAAHDPFWLMAGDLAVAVIWWHPLVWWGRNRLRSASEVAADEASALIPGGPHVLAECLVRFGRELTGAGPVPSMGVAGNGRRSDLAARIEQLLAGQGRWRSSSIWVRWAPSGIACLAGAVVAALPMETGLGATFLAMFAVPANARAQDVPPQDARAPKTNAVVAAEFAAVSNSPAVEPVALRQKPANQVSREAPISSATAEGSAPFTYQWNSNGTNAASAMVAEAQPAYGQTPSFGVNTTGTTPLFYQWKINGTNIAPAKDAVANASAVQPEPRIQIHRAKVKLQAEFVEVADADSKGLGIDWIFGSATNDAAPKSSHDWNDLESPQISRHLPQKADPTVTNAHPKNVTVDEYRTEGETTVLKPAQFKALRQRIIDGTTDDLLAAPAVECFSGNQAQIGVQDSDFIVTGVDARNGTATNQASVNYFTDKVLTGVSVDLVARFQDDKQWRLTVAASVLKFLHYDSPGEFLSVSASHGKPLQAKVPLPHFRKIDAIAEGLGSTGFNNRYPRPAMD